MLVRAISQEEIEFFGVNVTKFEYLDHENNHHTAISFYQAGETANVRVHNVIPDIDLLLNQNKYSYLIDSINYLKHNSGILLFINKPPHQQTNMKEYGIGAQILKSLGIKHMRLIAESKTSDFVGLGGFGLDVVEIIDPAS